MASINLFTCVEKLNIAPSHFYSFFMATKTDMEGDNLACKKVTAACKISEV